MLSLKPLLGHRSLYRGLLPTGSSRLRSTASAPLLKRIAIGGGRSLERQEAARLAWPRRSPFSSSSESPQSAAVFSRAPFPVRVALVGTTVGLATPLYVVGGFAVAWRRYLPDTLGGLIFKYGILILAGGGLSVITTDYILPFLKNHSEFVLPFAVSNGLTSAVLYAIGELVFGFEAMSSKASILTLIKSAYATSLIKSINHFPLVGPSIGLLTVFISPLLWTYMFERLWSKDLNDLVLNDDPGWVSRVYSWIIFPVGVPMGILAGVGLQEILRPLIVGTASRSWTMVSLPTLAAVSGLWALYFSHCRTNSDEYFYITRINPTNGQLYSYNIRNSTTILDNGVLASNSKSKRDITVLIASTISAFSAIREKIPKVLDEIESDFMKGKSSSGQTISNGSSSDTSVVIVNTRDSEYSLRLQSVEALRLPKMKDVSCHDVDRLERMMAFFEFLARYKHATLQLQRLTRSSKVDNNYNYSQEIDVSKKVIKSLEQAARDRYGINDLSDCWNKIELGILQSRKLAASSSEENSESAGVNNELKKKNVLDAFAQITACCQAGSDKTPREALNHVCANIDQFDAFISESIGYNVCEASEEDIVRDISLSRWKYIATATAKLAVGVSIPLTMIYAYLKM